MRVAIVFNNKVINVIVSEDLTSASGFLPLLYPDVDTSAYSVLDADEAQIGGVGFELIDGIWEAPYSVAVMGWDFIRSERNILLSRCDWTQLPDNQLSDAKKLEWANYRQALRDLPSSFDTPKAVVFPALP